LNIALGWQKIEEDDRLVNSIELNGPAQQRRFYLSPSLFYLRL